MLFFLDKALLVLHTLVMGFNMFGWAWRRTRLCHLIVLLATSFSWFVLGAYYGWGYCICTDWQFSIRRQLGYPEVGSSFLQLLAAEFGLSMSQTTSDWLAGGVFALIVLATAATWARQLASATAVRSPIDKYSPGI
jgi:hypothetical protein